MKRKQILPGMFFLFLVFAMVTSPLGAENIIKILEGYGRDSTLVFSTRQAQGEAGRLFNLILEPDGKVVVSRAEEYMQDTRSPVIRSYLNVMLADYYLVNNQHDSGLRYMKRAVDEYDPIRNDSYYRLVLARAQQMINESPGKTEDQKQSVLDEFSPPVLKTSPLIETIREMGQHTPETQTAESREAEPAAEKGINFRIQIGAFSREENAMQKKSDFEARGYPVDIETRETSSGYLYVVRVGAYETNDEARSALSELKMKYPSEDGIVIRIAKQ
ncbi:MAG: SPOR domain-containing protein [FCB group bacterium]|nr:SPOR domain-containing protein [FCB group bacterium]